VCLFFQACVCVSINMVASLYSHLQIQLYFHPYKHLFCLHSTINGYHLKQKMPAGNFWSLQYLQSQFCLCWCAFVSESWQKCMMTKDVSHVLHHARNYQLRSRHCKDRHTRWNRKTDLHIAVGLPFCDMVCVCGFALCPVSSWGGRRLRISHTSRISHRCPPSWEVFWHNSSDPSTLESIMWRQLLLVSFRMECHFQNEPHRKELIPRKYTR